MNERSILRGLLYVVLALALFGTLFESTPDNQRTAATWAFAAVAALAISARDKLVSEGPPPVVAARPARGEVEK